MSGVGALADYHAEALLGLCVLGYVAWTKWIELGFRRRAVRVTGEVIRVLSYRNFRSVFANYPWDGARRTAECRVGHLAGRLSPGEAIELLVDPSAPPDVPVPSEGELRAATSGGGAGCGLADAPLLSLWDGLYIAIALALVIHSFAF